MKNLNFDKPSQLYLGKTIILRKTLVFWIQIIHHRDMMGMAMQLFSEEVPNNCCHCRIFHYFLMKTSQNILQMLYFNITIVLINRFYRIDKKIIKSAFSCSLTPCPLLMDTGKEKILWWIKITSTETQFMIRWQNDYRKHMLQKPNFFMWLCI